MSFESQMAIIKQWIIKTVGVNPATNKVNKCLVIYDYIKLMSSDDISDSLQEYQALGFMVTSLHNLAVKYDFPIFATIQLNRDGIDKENSAVMSGSDRILWLCSNFSILKNKSDEEIAKDGIVNGNKKIVVCDCRHGPGLAYNDYINVKMDGSLCDIQEGATAYEIYQEKNAWYYFIRL